MTFRPSLFALTLLAATAVTGPGCKKDTTKTESDPKSPSTTTTTTTTTTTVSDAAPPSTPVDAALTDTEKVAAAIKKNEASDATEKARWTPEIEKAALELHDKEWKDATEALTAILASPHREPGNKDRDGQRHPLETLTFFGVTPSSYVVEVGAGGGWYTELLAPLLAAKGTYVVAAPDANGPMDKMSTAYGKSVDSFLAKSKLFDKVQRVAIGGTPPYKLGEDGKASHVLAIREMHNWQRRGELDAYLAAIHGALADGGTFGVVAHRAKPGTKGEDTAESGYLDQDWVIAKVEAAGFRLAEKSEINANPKDTKDYPKGVWTLAPNFREGDATKEKYAPIGESDRMTLKFTKVAK